MERKDFASSVPQNSNLRQNESTNNGDKIEYNKNDGYISYQASSGNLSYAGNPTYIMPYYPAQKKQSGLGIASFVMSLVSIISYIITIFVAGALQLEGDISDSGLAIVGLFVILIGLMNITALILGIVALFMKNRKKSLAVAGIIINVIAIIGIILLMIIGSAQAASAGGMGNI